MRRQISTRAVVQRGVYPVHWTQVVPQAVQTVLGMIVRGGQVSLTNADGRPQVALSTTAEIWAENESGETQLISLQMTHFPDLALAVTTAPPEAVDVTVELVGAIEVDRVQVTGEGVALEFSAQVRVEVVAPAMITLDAVSPEEVGETEPQADPVGGSESSGDSSGSAESGSDSSGSDSTGDDSNLSPLSDVTGQARLASASYVSGGAEPPASWATPGLRSVSITRFQGRATTGR